VLVGPVAGDPSALPAWMPRTDAWPRHVLVTHRMADHGPVPEIIASLFDGAVVGLEEATGVSADRIEPPLPPRVDDDWFTTVGLEELTWIGRDVVAARAGELTTYVRDALGDAAMFTADDYLAARRRRFEAVKVLDRLLADDAVLVTPTMCVEGFYADGRLPGGGDEPGAPSSAYNTQVANITGHPALSLPAGRSPNGVPFGIQITGPRFADDMVLAVGAAWEATHPWPIAAPGFEPFGA